MQQRGSKKLERKVRRDCDDRPPQNVVVGIFVRVERTGVFLIIDGIEEMTTNKYMTANQFQRILLENRSLLFKA